MSQRRIVLPHKQPKIKEDNVISIDTVNSVLEDAIRVISLEMVKFRGKVNQGYSLSPAEARVFQGYIKSMVDLSKEARERERSDDLSKLSDEEVVLLAKKALMGKEATVVEEDDSNEEVDE